MWISAKEKDAGETRRAEYATFDGKKRKEKNKTEYHILKCIQCNTRRINIQCMYIIFDMYIDIKNCAFVFNIGVREKKKNALPINRNITFLTLIECAEFNSAPLDLQFDLISKNTEVVYDGLNSQFQLPYTIMF